MPLSAPLLRRSAWPRIRRLRRPTAQRRRSGKPCKPRATPPPRSLQASSAGVSRRPGVAPNAFRFANAHRVYIYDAFATSAAELKNETRDRMYRACPLTTKPRMGDLICEQREATLADASDEAVRERIQAELDGSADARTVRRTHCEVVVHVDAPGRKVYTIGGNVNQAVTARKLNLHCKRAIAAA